MSERPTDREIIAANPGIAWAEPMLVYACRVCAMTGEGELEWFSIDRARIVAHLKEKHGL